VLPAAEEFVLLLFPCLKALLRIQIGGTKLGQAGLRLVRNRNPMPVPTDFFQTGSESSALGTVEQCALGNKTEGYPMKLSGIGKPIGTAASLFQDRMLYVEWNRQGMEMM
jgi:hypothetical protein